MTHNKINYDEVLRQHGYRITRQREVVLDAICRAGGHAAVAEIYALARQEDPGIDRSTLYRSLDTFVKLGLVNSAEDLSGERRYEIVQEEPHHHLVCRLCGGEVRIENCLVDEFFHGLQQAYDYTVGMDHLVLFGICAGCSEEGRAKN